MVTKIPSHNIHRKDDTDSIIANSTQRYGHKDSIGQMVAKASSHNTQTNGQKGSITQIVTKALAHNIQTNGQKAPSHKQANGHKGSST